MDDVDAAEALQAKNMLLSGDWVTQRLDGILYLDKAPLKYWITASLYELLGIHDWVARLPTILAVILLCWLVTRMAGFYSGLVMATSIGLFLFTRTVIPDVILTLFITVSLWCFFSLLESPNASFRWAFLMYTSMACAVLTKGFIGVLFPVLIGIVYLATSRKLTNWRRLYPFHGLLLFLFIAAPWHILAILHNPPTFDITLNAGPHFGGQFRGFFWFYFINEQLLRFLNLRWPHDYNTVPRLWFWLYHFLWFFPWILFAPALLRVSFRVSDRASRLRLLALCWAGVVLIFFTFSTTQEYYSMPMYPAIAILLGAAMSVASPWRERASKVAAIISLASALLIIALLIKTRSLPTTGDIFNALSQHPEFYTLSLGHMADLTIPALAYLRLPLAVACIAFLAGGAAVLIPRGQRAYVALAVMLVVFFQAARLALVVFDPYLSSYAVAQKLNHLPKGTVIVCGKYNPLSSVFFYSQDQSLQNDPDLDILEYGSLAPAAPKLYIDDPQMKSLWNSNERVYIVAKSGKLAHVKEALGSTPGLIFQSGDKYLFANYGRLRLKVSNGSAGTDDAAPQSQ